MAGGVADGQPVDAAITDPAFIIKNADDDTPSRLGFGSTQANAGPSIVSSDGGVQRLLNALSGVLGIARTAIYNFVYPWANNDVGASSDTVAHRADLITQKFAATTGAGGHAHTGVDGDGAAITASSVAAVPLSGVMIEATDLVGVTGGSTDVSTPLAGKPVSTTSTAPGIVTNFPLNKVIVRNSTNDAEYVDGSGNVVYARISNTGGPSGTWTLTYYSEVAGVETPYSFSGSNGVRWYYQQLFNPLSASWPVYSPLAFVPSDNATSDVITATTSTQGKVQLASSAAADVGVSGSAGTANATVANADHVHQGVHSVGVSSAIFGDVLIAGAGGSSVAQLSQTITVTSPALSSTTPADVAATGTVGVGTTTARADHAHKGVHSVGDGLTPVYGDATFSGSGGTTVLTTGQNTAITSPALSTTTPADVAATGAVGVGTTSARADHAHKGVHSVSAGTALYGDVVLAAGANVTVGTVGNTITINATGGGGGGSLQWVEASVSPEPSVEYNMQNYLYASGLSQNLFAQIDVPNSYVAGTQIKLRSKFYSPDNSGTALLQTKATLIRTGTDAASSTTNQRTSTNTAVTLGAGTVNKPQQVIFDLTDASGNINGVAVSPGDTILVALTRGTDTATSDIRAMVYDSTPTFS